MVETRPAEPQTGQTAGESGDQTAESGQRVLERREAPRYPAGRIGFRSPQIQATLVDLSSEGLAIESLEHPPIGSSLEFALEQGRVRAEADGRVCWCNLKRTYRTIEGDVVAVYRAGLRLGSKHPRVFDSIARAARLESTAGNA